MKPGVDLILVNPGNRNQVYRELGLSLAGIEPPIWAALSAAVVRRQGYTVKIVDAEIENLNLETTVSRRGNIPA